MKKEIGSIVVTEIGNVVLLTALDQQGEMRPNGAVDVYDFGIVLRGTTAEPGTGARIPFPSSNNVRIIAPISRALEVLEQSGLDLRTRPERPLTSLDPLERIARLEKATK